MNVISIIKFAIYVLNNIYHDKTSQKCVPCESEYCSDCNDDYKYCKYCFQGGDYYGYTIDNDGVYTGKCSMCPYQCKECDSNECRYCREGYGFIIDGSSNNKCGKCPENCYDCYSNNQICVECDIGYDLEVDSKNQKTGKCRKCSENCYYCSNSQVCEICSEGYMQDESGNCFSCPEGCQECFNSDSCYYCLRGFYSSGDKCIKCADNCEYCHDNNSCEDCIDGFTLNKNHKNNNDFCIQCPENCKSCYTNASLCDRCINGYGFIHDDNVNTYKCGKCKDPNCIYCAQNNNDCYNCKEGYCIELSANSVSNHYCVQCSEDPDVPTKCLVEGCIKCVPQTSDQCEKCDSSLVLNDDKKCVKPGDITPTPVPTPSIFEVDYNDVEDGKYSCNIDKKEGDESSLEIELDFTKDNQHDKVINEVLVTNENKKKIQFTISEGYEELIFSVTDKSLNEFDLINSANSIKINLDKSTFASIKQGKGQIEINSTKENEKVNLNQVQPSSNDFKIIPISPILIKEVQFSENSASLLVESTDNKKVEIQSIKVQSGKEGSIQNTKITGKVTLASFSSLSINENVDLSDSTLDFSYSLSALGDKEKAPIRGEINGRPRSIIITSRKDNTWLEEEKLLLVESTKDFECDSWGNLINYQSSGKLNDFNCIKENNIKRLYAIENPNKKGDGGGKGLNAGAIAGIVVAVVVVVGIVVFVLVYFLVIKKKSKESSGSEDGDDKNTNEV